MSDKMDYFVDALRMLPVTGQVMDVIDTARALNQLRKAPNNPDLQLEVVICIIGWIPGPGDALKIGLRRAFRDPSILFEMTRTVMVKFGAYGDPEQWLNQKLSQSELSNAIYRARNKITQYIRETSWLPNAAIPHVEYSCNWVANNMATFAGILMRKIAHIKPHANKTSHQQVKHVNGPEKTQKTPSNPSNAKKKDDVHNKTRSKSKDKAGSKGSSKTDGKHTKPSHSAILGTLTNNDTGVIAEHIGDYWVADKLKIELEHDKGQSHARKLDGPMTQLTDAPRGVGLDSLWETAGHPIKKGRAVKPYVVVDYKGSKVKKRKSTGSLVSQNKGKKLKATSGAGSVLDKRNKNDEPTKGTKEPENQQMSKKWTDERMKDKHSDKIGKTDRFILFFGLDTISRHGLEKAKERMNPKQAIVAANHKAHTVTYIINSKQIDEVVNRRTATKSKSSKP